MVAVPFDQRRPSALTLRWAENSLGGRTRVVAWRRMTGGISSAVHRLTVDDGGHRDVVVLRQYESTDTESVALVHQEAATLRALDDTALPRATADCR